MSFEVFLFLDDNCMWIEIIIRICIRISSLPYRRFDISTLDNSIQIDHSVKITNPNKHNVSKGIL